MPEVTEGRVVPTPGPPAPDPDSARSLRYEHIALVDLLDRLLAGGVVISGEVRLAIADVDLVNVSLHAMISSVGTLLKQAGQTPGQDLEDG